MSVGVADDIRRCTVSSSDLDDLGSLVRSTDNPSAYLQPISDHCAHANPSQRSFQSMDLA